MFYNRQDAGEQLGRALKKYQNGEDVIVLGIPKGGVATAYYVADFLRVPFSMIVARKLGFPRNPEAAFGAIAEEGGKYLNPYATKGMASQTIKAVMREEQKEMEHRIDRLRMGKPLPDLKDKVVILVDDGIATGATILAAIQTCKKQDATKIVVAAPVSSGTMYNQLKREVDEVVILDIPENYYAVSQVYEEFSDFTEDEVRELFQRQEGGEGT